MCDPEVSGEGQRPRVSKHGRDRLDGVPGHELGGWIVPVDRRVGDPVLEEARGPIDLHFSIAEDEGEAALAPNVALDTPETAETAIPGRELTQKFRLALERSAERRDGKDWGRKGSYRV